MLLGYQKESVRRSQSITGADNFAIIIDVAKAAMAVIGPCSMPITIAKIGIYSNVMANLIPKLMELRNCVSFMRRRTIRCVGMKGMG